MDFWNIYIKAAFFIGIIFFCLQNSGLRNPYLVFIYMNSQCKNIRFILYQVLDSCTFSSNGLTMKIHFFALIMSYNTAVVRRNCLESAQFQCIQDVNFRCHV